MRLSPSSPSSTQLMMLRSHSSTSASTNPPSLGRALHPGTVLILLAGRFMGKRVVFLKQLPLRVASSYRSV
ncbi:hypothetical protein Patl1_01380 [Pistacia atlantica]|uniref:Uncharacterized protein n=1 Tax=Pistacia atlantica TaxID=434234 RepID=A0ACC1C426_9ROSI|nr:hypothetical protein Patl1_01380 [Pistacia atlantica]